MEFFSASTLVLVVPTSTDLADGISVSVFSCRKMVGLVRKLTNASAAWDSLTCSDFPDPVITTDEEDGD